MVWPILQVVYFLKQPIPHLGMRLGHVAAFVKHFNEFVAWNISNVELWSKGPTSRTINTIMMIQYI